MTFFSAAIGGLIGELEEQKRLSEKIADIRTWFAATISHEIRTPLTVVLGMADVLDSTELNPQQRKYLNSILSSGKYLHNLVNDVLTFTKLESSSIILNRDPFALMPMIGEIEKMFQERIKQKIINFEIVLQCPQDIAIISDRARVMQVLINLLGNAYKFTPPQEKIILQVDCSIANDRALLQFSVTDTGPGIPAERLEAIFEEYEQTYSVTGANYGGTGLGLPISQKIAQALNGKIEVSSQLKQGSTFKFTFPAEIAQQEVATRSSVLQLVEEFKSIKQTLTILHIDDHEDIRLLFELYFAGTPHTVVSLEDPRQAITEYEQHNFDFVISDQHMPQIRGLEFFTKLKEIDSMKNRKKAVFILCSGSIVELPQGEAAVFDDYLIKPFKKEDIYKAILKHLPESSKK